MVIRLGPLPLNLPRWPEISKKRVKAASPTTGGRLCEQEGDLTHKTLMIKIVLVGPGNRG